MRSAANRVCWLSREAGARHSHPRRDDGDRPDGPCAVRRVGRVVRGRAHHLCAGAPVLRRRGGGPDRVRLRHRLAAPGLAAAGEDRRLARRGAGGGLAGRAAGGAPADGARRAPRRPVGVPLRPVDVGRGEGRLAARFSPSIGKGRSPTRLRSTFRPTTASSSTPGVGRLGCRRVRPRSRSLSRWSISLR